MSESTPTPIETHIIKRKPIDSNQQHFSDLEVDARKLDYPNLEVDNRKHLSDPEVVNLDHSNLEVTPGYRSGEVLENDNLQAYHPAVSGNKDASGPIPVHPDNENYEKPTPESPIPRIWGIKRRTFWICLFAVIILVILAAVGGTVGGVVGSNHKSSSGSGSPSATTSAGTATPTSSSTPSSSATAVTNTGILHDSKLAALAWTITSTHYKYRVYYQDVDNSIKESAYDSTTGSWSVLKIVNGSGVSPGTSIAASSSKQAFSSGEVDINLYYFDANLDLAVISASLGVWNSTPIVGPVTAGQSTTKTRGKLSAYYHECRLCPNTTLVAHAFNGTVAIYNGTSSSAWKDQIYVVETNAFESSEVSFQPYSTTTYADQVNLYYQRSDKTLVLTSWFSWQYQRDNNMDLSSTRGWQSAGNNGVVGNIQANSSFATLYFGNNSGSPEFVEVLTSGTDLNGLQLFEWVPNSWDRATTPSGIQNVTMGTAIAAHFYQRAYVLVDGVLTQLAVGNDGWSWSVNAAVPTL